MRESAHRFTYTEDPATGAVKTLAVDDIRWLSPREAALQAQTTADKAVAREREKWQRLVAEGLEAFRLTKEYVNIPDENGFVLLPDVEGWSHFDWTVKARAALGEEGIE